MCKLCWIKSLTSESGWHICQVTDSLPLVSNDKSSSILCRRFKIRNHCFNIYIRETKLVFAVSLLRTIIKVCLLRRSSDFCDNQLERISILYLLCTRLNYRQRWKWIPTLYSACAHYDMPLSLSLSLVHPQVRIYLSLSPPAIPALYNCHKIQCCHSLDTVTWLETVSVMSTCDLSPFISFSFSSSPTPTSNLTVPSTTCCPGYDTNKVDCIISAVLFFF